jgi:AcrR family transcriptional regulator/DNA-binding MarR family transcriptional regulator
MSTSRERPVGRRRGSAPAAAAAVSRRGGMQLSEVQRSRMLSSAVAVVSEYGYGQMTVARVADGARVSRRTFYDLFDDREDCFLAAFDDAVLSVSGLVFAAYGGERGWRAQVRAGLGALLWFLDEEPGLGSLLVVDALKAGPRVQERRAEILERLAGLLQREGRRAGTGRELSPLTGEGVVGAVLGVIYTRLQAKDSGRMVELLNPLMAMIVLPYLGPAVAQRELGHHAPKLPVPGDPKRVTGKSSSTTRGRSPLEGLQMRLTYRTLRVLTAISEQPGASNREVAAHAEVSDQGQISKLLARLERLGLIENRGEGQPSGEPNAWWLTSRGEEILDASRPTRNTPHKHAIPTEEKIR